MKTRSDIYREVVAILNQRGFDVDPQYDDDSCYYHYHCTVKHGGLFYIYRGLKTCNWIKK